MAAKIGQTVADVPSGLSLTPPQETEKKTETMFEALTAVNLNILRYDVVQSDNNLPMFAVVSCLSYCSTLKVEAVYSSETSVNLYQTTFHHVPENNTVQVT
jgi:hypothetical protein